MGTHNLSDLQKKLLSMLKWFDAFCRNNELRYYIIGGTMLGAARHRGFIPWDDDIDVALPRADYERLQKILADKVIDNYLLETPKSKDSGFFYPYCKLYDTQTLLVENCRKPLVRGVFIDVFPLDGIGNDYSEGLKCYSKARFFYHLYLTRITSIRKGRNLVKNGAVIISRSIPESVLSTVKLRVKVDEMCKKYSFDDSTYGGLFLGNWGVKEIMPRRFYGKPTEYKFEDITVFGVEQYDNYLVHVYGNWKKIPPKDKQVTHHDFLLLDLNKSYFDYSY